MNNVYKFVSWDAPDLEGLCNSVAYRLLNKLNNNEKLTRDEKDNGIFKELFHIETYRTGKYKLQGYVFDFSPFMKRYLVNHKYFGWREIRAFDKTAIRHNAANPSYILEIVEISCKERC